MTGMDTKELRERIGAKWRSDPVKIEAEEKRIASLRDGDPEHFQMYVHLFGAQWYRGGPISRAELAELLDVGARSVERWEAGGTVPHRLARKAIDQLREAVA